jgi:hypothetical protein
MILKRFAFFLLLSLACLTRGISQQTYPIQVNVHLLPPYSLYLSDYYSGTREKLTVTLINRDQLKPTVNVKLRMIITAPGGIRIQTNDNAYFQPVIVESGSPVRLTQDDLAQYFQPANLITQGYLTAGKLPEGMVEFCFQAIEAYTGQVLSASTCTRAWITSQKPPLLSLPRNKESIAFRDPLNVLFQWTPLHQGLGLVEYDFILKELWDNGMTPQAAFAYSPEIYRETTQSTSIIYGAMQPPLLAGKRYAWCVRAKAREGLDEVNLFQNDGYSEIRWFTLQDNCAPPQYVQAATERKRINLEWNTLPEYIGFTVSYRLKSNADQPQAEWKELQLQDTKATLYGLQSGGTYEYRVASMCMTGQPVYTPVFTITVPMADSARLAQCGILPAVNLTNQEPIKELKTAEVFKAGDFPITIVSISGANGNFSGQGWTIIPWLNDARIAVEFKSITINTDRQMTNGIVEAKYDKNEGQIANLDDVFEGGFDVGNVKTGLTQPDYKFDFSIPGVDAFALNNNGELVITDDTGEPHTVTAADKEGEGNEGNKVVVFPMTVQDKDGNVYSVEKETKTDANGKTTEVAKATYLGKVGTPLAAGSFDPTQLNGDKAIVTFTKGGGKYAFDTWKEYYDKIALIQDKYQKLYTNYYAPWKFLPSGQTDKITATIEIKDETIKPELVIFKTPTGTEYEAVRNDKTYTLQVASGPEGDVQELYALYPRENGKYYTLGKLGIATYAPQNYNVVLVAVDNAYVNYEKIEQTLKETYDSVGVTWTVSRDAFAYNASELMKNSTGLSTYNDAMRDLNNAYRAAHPDFNSNSNYLFFLKATGNTDEINNRDLTGFMPRGAQFGYIFTSEVKDADEPITVAHELGHGRWKLYHPFDKHYGGFDEAKQTNNLLAYGNGSHIAKWQWDQMNDPAMLVSVFESDDKGKMIVTTKIPKDFLNADGSATFITPAGESIIIPPGFKSINFSHSLTGLDDPQLNYVTGTLYGFTTKEGILYKINTEEKSTELSVKGSSDDVIKDYYSLWKNLKMTGYKGSDGSIFKSDYSKVPNPNKVVMLLPCEDEFKYYEIKITTLPKYSGSTLEIKSENTFPINLDEAETRSVASEYTNKSLGDEVYQITELEREIISGHCDEEDFFVFSKIAQIAKVYPLVYGEFKPASSQGHQPIFKRLAALRLQFDPQTDVEESLIDMRVLIECIQDKRQNAASILKDLTLNTDPTALMEALQGYKSSDFLSLTVYQKITILKVFNKTSVLAPMDYRFETIVNTMLKSTLNSSQSKEMWDSLSHVSNASLLIELYHGIDGKECDTYVDILTGYFSKYYEPLVAPNIRYYFWNTNGASTKAEEHGDYFRIWSLLVSGTGLSTQVTDVGDNYSGDHPPLGAVTVVFFGHESGADERLMIDLPAIYLYRLVDKESSQSNLEAITLISNFIGLYSATRLIISGSTRLAQALGAIELLNTVTNIIVLNENVKTQLRQTETGNNFLKAWPYISTGVSLGTLATDVLSNFASGYRANQKIFTQLTPDDAAKLEAKVTEAESVLSKQANSIVSFAKYSEIDNWLKPLANSTSKSAVENIIKNWSDDLLISLNSKLNLYPGLKSEFLASSQLLNYFNSLETTWWTKYALGGLAKRTNPVLPAAFRQMVGEIEITSLGEKLLLRTVSLEETSASYIGKLFDEAMETRMIDAWRTGNFSDLPGSVSTQLQSLKNQGYELAVEGQLTINGKNPVPDYLFIKRTNTPNGIVYDINNVKYVDCKYLWDSPFTISQKEIVKEVTTNGVALATAPQGVRNVNDVEIVLPGTVIRIRTVEKLTVDRQMQLVIQ